MRFVRTARIIAIVSAFALIGAAPAWATTTIDSGHASIGGGTLADCDNTDVEDSDIPIVPLFNGPFNYSQSVSPAPSVASCADGSGSDSTTGSLSTSGTVDPTGDMTLSQTSFGQTTASVSYTGNPQSGGSIDVGLGVNSDTAVDFTTTTAMPYTFSGTASGTQLNNLHYSLVRTDTNPGQTIFDDSAGVAPNLSGILPAGSYSYSSSAGVSNDICCNVSGRDSDRFAYNWQFSLGDHYQVELKAWVPQAQTVDPYQPQSLPAPLTEIPPLSTARPLCMSLPNIQNGSTQVSTSERGDGHAGFAGASRVDVVADFDWDGSQISNFTVSPASFGPTDLDFSFSPIAGGAPFATCTSSATATHAASGAVRSGGASFDLSLAVSDPLATPQFALPAMDSLIQGSFDPHNNLQLAFATDLFPSYAVEVTRNGVLQETSIVNDASCLASSSVLGTTGLSLLSLGLSPTQQNSSTLLVPTSSQGHTASRSSPLCSTSYDTLQIASGSGPSFPAADVGATAAAALPKVSVAPAKGGHFVSLSQAIRAKLVAGVQRGGVTALLVDPRHPVRIKVLGKDIVVQESGVAHGHVSGGVRFGPANGTLVLSAGKTLSATANGHKLTARKPDHKPPHTTAKITVKGKFAIVHLHATDASGIAQTILVVKGKLIKLRHGTAKIKLSQLSSARYYSIDVLGNTERAHRLPKRH